MRRDNRVTAVRLAGLLGLFLLGGDVGRVDADTILLRGGGQVQGKVLADPKDRERVQILLLKGRNPLSFKKAQIAEVIPKPSALDEYITRREKLAPKAQAEFELGAWCDLHQLGDLARLHFELALRHDEAFEPAHKKLGHILHDGKWLTQDQLRQVQGLVKYKGRWVTEEEKTKLDDQNQVSASQSSWIRRIKILRQAILSGTDDRRREAESKLMQIHEAEAVVPLVRVFGQDDVPMRTLLAQVLGVIPGKESAGAMVDLLLGESESSVREIAMRDLKERDEPTIVPRLIKALRSENVRVINRAAWALGNLEASSAVPRLVGVLVTTETRMVIDPQEGAQPVGPILGPVPMAFNGSFVAYLTPPAVGPGVIAFGATSAPYWTNPGLLGGGLQVNGAGNGPNRGPMPKMASFTYQNVEVLEALVKLTGQDYGYDQDSWRRWVAASFNPNPAPVRRVPQP